MLSLSFMHTTAVLYTKMQFSFLYESYDQHK